MIGAPVHIEVPKSNRMMPVIHVTNCCQSGRSSPSRARSLSRLSFDAKALSPMNLSSTMSPGTTRIRKKMRTATPSSVGIISRSRLTMYLVTPAGPRSLGEPDRVELLVQVVARRDRPAPHLRIVGHDPVPLQRDEGVRLLVEQPALELAHVPLALLGINGAVLLLVELVEYPIGIAAVVGVADVLRLELRQVEIGLDRVAALRVAGDREVTGPKLGHVLRRLDGLHRRVEPDLAPLVDEPDPDRLVGHGHPAVHEREGETLGHPGFLEQALGLGPRFLDVAPVSGELLQLIRRRRLRP